MGYGDYSALVLLQMLFEPVYALGVEVVGRFVQKQYVGLLQQQAAESHTATLAPGQGGYRLVVGWALKRIHCPGQFGVDVPCICSVYLVLKLGLTRHECLKLIGIFKNFRISEAFVHFLIFGQQVEYRLHTLAHNLYHCLRRIELRVLLQIANRISGSEYHFALITLVETGYDLQQ